MRLLSLMLLTLLSLTSLPGAAAGLRFSLVKTAETETLGAQTAADGQLTEKIISNHVAVLIEHHAATLLFDTSLGRQIDSQFDSEMPRHDKPLLQYGPVVPVRDQLEPDGIRIDRILLSHTHWDHASGLADYPEVPVWAPYEEIEFSQIATPPTVLPSQFKHGVNWVPFTFLPQAYMGFPESHDLFGDGSLVLVPLIGHTPGSVGLFLKLDDGRRFFFTGAASWRMEDVNGPREKLWMGRAGVDNDHDATRRALEQVNHLIAQEPQLTIVPAHDAQVHQSLGYYPSWVE